MVARRCLVIGDAHIPDRANGLPAKFERRINELAPFDYVLCTGDLGTSPETQRQLEGWCGNPENFHIVQGNMDYFAGITHPTLQEIAISDSIQIGLTHGHQIHPRGDRTQLAGLAKKLGVQILISGHSHAEEIFLDKKENVLLLNPGSCTGAWSFVASGIPSFILLEIILGDHTTINVELNQLRGQKIKRIVWQFPGRI